MRSLLDITPPVPLHVSRKGMSRFWTMPIPGTLKVRQVSELAQVCRDCAAFVPNCEVDIFVGKTVVGGKNAPQSVVKIAASRSKLAELVLMIERALRAKGVLSSNIVLHT